MNCWLWLAFFFVFVVLPEVIKAFQVQNDYLCILNPDGGISLAQRQRLQRQWLRTMKSVACRIARWKISRKVTMLLRWAKATTWKSRLQVLFALLMTFATDANKAMYEKSLEEGVTVYQILCAGLEALWGVMQLYFFQPKTHLFLTPKTRPLCTCTVSLTQ